MNQTVSMRFDKWLAWFVLALALLITVAAWWGARALVAQRLFDQFHFESQEVAQAIRQRMRDYEQALAGARGLFAASHSVSRDEFKAYVAALDLAENYPGSQGLGFSEVFTPGELRSMEHRIRADGAAGFRVWPVSGDRVQSTVKYLEPMDVRNQRAIGFDMMSEKYRREAMERARDSGRTAISGGVRLVQESDIETQPGFLMYVPVYANGARLGSVAERRAALTGFVHGAFRSHDFVKGVFASTPVEVGFAIDDVTSAEDGSKSLFRSSGNHVSAGYGEDLRHDIFLELGGRRWRLTVWPRAKFFAKFASSEPEYVAALGLLSSLLLFFACYFYATRSKRAADQLLVEALEAAPGGISLVSADGILLASNQEARLARDHNRHHVKEGTRYSEVLQEAVEKYALKLSAVSEPMGGGQIYDRLKSSGEPFVASIMDRWYLVRSRRLSDGSLVVGSSDITALKQHEIELARATEAAQSASRYKTEFLATMSHELRNPLTSIIGSLGVILGNPGDELPAKVTRLVEIALNNSRRLVKLINEILDVEKIEAGVAAFELRETKFVDIVREAVTAMNGLAAERQVKLIIDPQSIDAPVLADRDRMVQVLVNLISNGVKFSPPGGLVTIVVCRHGQAVRCSVRDQGEGIPEEFRTRIFERHAQSETGPQSGMAGSGLGLSIVRSIVTQLKGEVSFESEKGCGTVFHVDLPAIGLHKTGAAA